MQYPPFVATEIPGPSPDGDFGNLTTRPPQVDPFIEELLSEKQRVDPTLIRVHEVIDRELEKRAGKQEPEYLEVDIEKPIKLVKKILIPVARHPNFNFVGKLMGPGGSTLKSMQEKLAVKLNVWGRGSTKDSSKEEALLATGEPKYAHLKECLHVRVTVVAPPIEAYKKMSEALEEVKKHLNPDMGDDISKAQITTLGFNPQKYANQPAAPRGRGGAIPPVGHGRGMMPMDIGYDYGTQNFLQPYGYPDQ
ncbi:unnamed protein product [Soboliphyme baturini]|uniref:KH domain-containing protein n=1 Tax=Soboliphyme baturini TaxID=241478 RepID=A0A183J2Z9_9BILA|nr:unnamed protein product [Soboliphyme baturini]